MNAAAANSLAMDSDDDGIKARGQRWNEPLADLATQRIVVRVELADDGSKGGLVARLSMSRASVANQSRGLPEAASEPQKQAA